MVTVSSTPYVTSVGARPRPFRQKPCVGIEIIPSPKLSRCKEILRLMFISENTMLRGSFYLSKVCDVLCYQGSSISCPVLTGHVSPLLTFISTTYDSQLFRSNSDDDADVLEKGPARRQKSPHSDTTSRAANTIETLPGKPQNVLENGCKPAKTSELPAIISTSAIVPLHNTENKEESSNTQ